MMFAALEWLKSINRPELLYSLLKDQQAKKVMVAWTTYDSEPYKEPEIPKANVGAWLKKDLIMKLWEPIFKSIDWDVLSLLAGVPKITTKLKFNFLRFNYMIYPDGTANPTALEALRGEVAAHINGVKWNKKGRES